MKRSTDRFLTTHVGSLARPKKISQYFQALAANEAVDTPNFEAELRKAVAEVVKRQSAAGVDIVSDGEFGKPSWLYLLRRVSGFETRMSERRSPGFLGAEREDRFAEYYDDTAPLDKRRQPFPRAVCVGPVSHTEAGRAQMRRDIANFKAALEDVSVEELFSLWWLPAACGWTTKTSITRPRKNFCSPWPMRCMKTISRSSMQV